MASMDLQAVYAVAVEIYGDTLEIWWDSSRIDFNPSTSVEASRALYINNARPDYVSYQVNPCFSIAQASVAIIGSMKVRNAPNAEIRINRNAALPNTRMRFYEIYDKSDQTSPSIQN